MKSKNKIGHVKEKKTLVLESDEYFILKKKIIMYIWPIASVFFIAFILFYFFIVKDYVPGWILFAVFLFFISTIYIYHKTKNVWLLGNALATLGMPVILPWLITGGPSGVGMWWSIVYVIWAFIVTDIKSAIFWLSTHFVFSVAIIILSSKGFVTIAYSNAELYNLLFAYVISIAYVFFLIKILEYYLQLSQKRSEELIQINLELASANKELEQFIYAASHDLQEPLRTVTNFLQLLEKRYKDKLDNDANDFINFAVDGSKKMSTLILSLLDYSNIKKIRTLENINLNDLLQIILKDLEYIINDNKAIINIEELPNIVGDKILISQLFQNLISNAIKFKDGNPPQINISSKKINNHYLFLIQDNGIGIQKEYENKLFTIFHRLNTNEKYPGIGIGLAMCKKIVEKHKGTIWFESEYGKGTTFYFTLNENGEATI